MRELNIISIKFINRQWIQEERRKKNTQIIMAHMTEQFKLPTNAQESKI